MSIRDFDVNIITNEIEKLCIESNYYVSDDIEKAFNKAIEKEEQEISKDLFNILIENTQIAKNENLPICQDTGMAVVFIEVGQEVHFIGNIEDAINEGVRRGYEKGYLRKSVVKDPVIRENTKDNTPAIIHYKIVEGDKVKVTVSPKGFGSENMSKIAMLKPSEGIEGVKNFIINTVKTAGPNACPPMVIGVGVGGDFEKSAIMAKEGLLREVGSKNKNEFWNEVEVELLEKINELNIGVGGFGGKTTALAIHINTFPTHIAGLPVAVNIGCHVTRHKEIIL
ncbi:MAG: fumarate hydratase [Lachnospirales bacterium]